MYLKSIEIHGFKSFAQKIRLEFHNGITGIVGPNGSGKSNIADAVRWVLGEQKVRQLRSTSMQDVIFAGTENRKPLSYAYVALTLDNRDHSLPVEFEEVTVARRVYRSGESDYLLNGHTCRLRDVQELFFDTGIGKEGYSIIGQGQIDQILSGKPEDRRELFDEAAGIVKFKRRKRTAVRKLEGEEQNLARVNDILSELRRQLSPLEKQSEAARAYLNKRDVLKDYEVNLFLLQSEIIAENLEKYEGKYRIAAEQKEQAEAAREKASREYEQAAAAMAQQEKKLEELRSHINEEGLEKERDEGRIRILKEQIRSNSENQQKSEERLKSLAESVKEKGEQRDKLEEELAELQDSLDAVKLHKADLAIRQESLQKEIGSSENRAQEAREKMVSLMKQQAECRTREQKFVTIREQAQIRRSSLQSSMLNEKADSDRIAQSLESEEEKFRKLSETIREKETKRESIRQKRMQQRKQLQELQERYQKGRDEIGRQTSRRDSLKNIAERYDGYGNSIRRVMERKKEEPGICGVVADLIKTEAKYETAIETALGGSIQNIVTEDEQTARKMISFLKKNHYGRATFLPLVNVRAPGNVPATRALSEEGALGMADTLVQTQEKYRGVIGHLLGRTLIADSMDHALVIARKFHQSIRIVTLGGELLQPGGAITGGAFRNNSNLLGRNREIESLDQQIRKLRSAQSSLKEQLESVNLSSEQLKRELNMLEKELQENYILQNTSKIRLEQSRKQKTDSQNSFTELKEEMKHLDQEISSAEQEEKKAAEQAKLLDGQIQAINQEERDRQSDSRDQEERRKQLADQISESSLEEASLVQKTEFANQNMQRLFTELRELEKEQEQIRKGQEDSALQIRQKEKEIASLQDKLDHSSTGLSDLQKEMENLTQQNSVLKKNSADSIQQREELAVEISTVEKELMRLQIRKDNISKEKQSLIDYLWSEYELTTHAAEEFRNPEYTDASALKKKISGLKSEIRALGNVNVNAIEEYKEVSERFTFLDNQRNDLEKAKDSLLKIIDELDDGMRRQFREKFAEIQKEFDRVFKELFGGGKGTLELTENEDILESGIQITAQPPGKKLQNMMQLSGGEKALTAISLLFAIQNLKPSPFCLLDEIEAALDDSNVDRFAKYLHKLTKHTQFIVITHRRGTMTAADRLYGITMQEKGVSTLVSVDLIENDLSD